ncbi:NAD(P)H-binding protein [uncultured Nocardioides sp.]|uniref:NAD(P)H-binding protein n=1 Tax=uncultured Nocardioides sp. TaxID=198441 RepID=UPI00262A5A39|nr:NAD(P)H-binding protein [uncultured Nocardioides sp.]
MSSPARLAVTGATGSLGGAVATALADLSPRLVVRSAARVPAALAGLDVAEASYDDGAACRAAFDGVDVLLLVSASESADRRAHHRSAIAAAAEAGVRHVVYTSFSGAAADATFTLGRDHADAEAALRDSGCGHTLLRDSFYAEVIPLFADATGAVRGPAGADPGGRVALVGRRDCSDVATRVLRDVAGGDDRHDGATYTLTGPSAPTLGEAVERAAAVVGRPLHYVEETLEEAYASRAAAYPDAADWQLDAWVSTYTAIADGSVAEVTDDVRRVLGREPRTIEQALGS